MRTRGIETLVAVGALSWCCGCTGMRPGTQVPDFTLTSLDDRQVSLSDYKGQVVLLTYWASW